MKPFQLNYFIISFIVIFFTWAPCNKITWQHSQDKLAAIKARGELHISTLNAPLIYYHVNSQPAGFDYDLAQLFAEYLGVKLKVHVRSNFNQLFDDLDNHKTDLLAASLIYNSEQLNRFTVGPSYYSVSQQLVYRLGQPRPKNLGDLRGQLAVASGSAQNFHLLELKKKQYSQLSWEVSSDLGSSFLLEKVANGKLDYTLTDSATVGLIQRVHPQLAVAFDITEEEPVTWYLNRSHNGRLLAALLDFFSELNDNGAMVRLEDKYLSYVGGFDYVDTKTFLNAIDMILPTLRPLFERYARDIDWKLLAAISYQESHWNPLATSVTGVRGLMMLTRHTADSLGISDRINAEQSVRGGAIYLSHMMQRVPDTIPKDEKIWFALAAYNMGYTHMLDARALTAKQHGNPDSWGDVKLRLPMLSQRRYYKETLYGYARGQQAYNYVENIRRYEISLVGYLQEKEKKNKREKDSSLSCLKR